MNYIDRLVKTIADKLIHFLIEDLFYCLVPHDYYNPNVEVMHRYTQIHTNGDHFSREMMLIYLYFSKEIHWVGGCNKTNIADIYRNQMIEAVIPPRYGFIRVNGNHYFLDYRETNDSDRRQFTLVGKREALDSLKDLAYKWCTNRFKEPYKFYSDDGNNLDPTHDSYNSLSYDLEDREQVTINNLVRNYREGDTSKPLVINLRGMNTEKVLNSMRAHNLDRPGLHVNANITTANFREDLEDQLNQFSGSLNKQCLFIDCNYPYNVEPNRNGWDTKALDRLSNRVVVYRTQRLHAYEVGSHVIHSFDVGFITQETLLKELSEIGCSKEEREYVKGVTKGKDITQDDVIVIKLGIIDNDYSEIEKLFN